MSKITNIILHVNTLDVEPADMVQKINRYLSDYPKGLISLDDPALPKFWYGGGKALEGDCFVGAFNHLDLQGLIRHIRGLNWPKGNTCVQAMVLEDQNYKFRIVDVVDDWDS